MESTVTHMIQGTTDLPEKKISVEGFPFLILFALCIDLFSPFLIWKGFLPPSIRWLSHLAVSIIVFLAIIRMLVLNRVPRITLLIAAASATWLWIAIEYGQGIVPTIWGWWLMFQYPLLCLYFYLQPSMPRSYPATIQYLCLAILTLEVLVQMAQYLTGQKPGDQLAGTFGRNGTGDLVLFLTFTICLTLGQWLAKRSWKPFLYALPLCVISSVLGEMKFFLPVLIALSGVALFVTFIFHKQFLRIIPYLALLCIFIASFVYAYDTFIPRARTSPLEQFIQQPQKLFNYLNNKDQFVNNEGEYYTDINRLYALSYGWDSIRKDPFTLLFGFGLGSRSESETLGATGVSLQRGDLGKTIGTSLLVMVQELGVVGCLLFEGVMVWIIFTLIRGIRKSRDVERSSLYYALLIYTIGWPIWLFYNTAWIIRVPMLLYWVSIGYALLGSTQKKSRKPLQTSYVFPKPETEAQNI